MTSNNFLFVEEVGFDESQGKVVEFFGMHLVGLV